MVDIGAGTGKFTRLLVATGADVTAVEPVDARPACIEAERPAVRTLTGSASYQHTDTPEQVIVDRFMSASFIAALPGA